MARVMPLYAGIETLERPGQSIQWGGAQLFADGFTKMPEGRARFSVVEPHRIEIPDGRFYLTTRRGKQFNSMTISAHDAVMGAHSRDEVLMAAADAGRLGLKDGDPVRLRSEVGAFTGRVRVGPVKPRYLQAYWPEVNVLISRRFDPVSGEPDYNGLVWIE